MKKTFAALTFGGFVLFTFEAYDTFTAQRLSGPYAKEAKLSSACACCGKMIWDRVEQQRSHKEDDCKRTRPSDPDFQFALRSFGG